MIDRLTLNTSRSIHAPEMESRERPVLVLMACRSRPKAVVHVGWLRELRQDTLVRDQAGGALCSARVPRNGLAARSSSFTSLRRTPHQPDPEPLRLLNGHTPRICQASDVGWTTQRGKGGGVNAVRPGGHERSCLPGVRCPHTGRTRMTSPGRNRKFIAAPGS